MVPKSFLFPSSFYHSCLHIHSRCVLYHSGLVVTFCIIIAILFTLHIAVIASSSMSCFPMVRSSPPSAIIILYPLISLAHPSISCMPWSPWLIDSYIFQWWSKPQWFCLNCHCCLVQIHFIFFCEHFTANSYTKNSKRQLSRHVKSDLAWHIGCKILIW